MEKNGAQITNRLSFVHVYKSYFEIIFYRWNSKKFKIKKLIFTIIPLKAEPDLEWCKMVLSLDPKHRFYQWNFIPTDIELSHYKKNYK